MKSDSYRSGADDDERFKIRFKKGRKPSSGGGEKKAALTFFRAVERLCRYSGGSSPHRNQKGKGAFTRNAGQTAQRVVVKIRVVRQPVGAKSLKALKLHLGYLTRPEWKRRARSAPGAATKTDRLRRGSWSSGRRRRRGIGTISASSSRREKGAGSTFTKYASELVREMEKDLGTGLDYLAVNHYNTDNPYVHLIVRGRNERGKDLVIGRDYLSSGVRNRAQEIATSRLGRRSELEIQDGLVAEFKPQRFTGIDRELLCVQGEVRKNVAT